MFETSKDLLNIAIAISVAGFAFFVCWAIYYFARIMAQVFGIIKDMRSRLHRIDELIKTFKEKIEHSTSYLLLIGEGVKKLVEVIKDRTGDRHHKKKEKK